MPTQFTLRINHLCNVLFDMACKVMDRELSDHGAVPNALSYKQKIKKYVKHKNTRKLGKYYINQHF